MNRFWDTIIKPCLEIIKANRIVEIGSDRGYGTEKIIKYCKENNAKLVSIDPFPKYDYREWEYESEGTFKIYLDLSINRLPLIEHYDVLFIDGDHNWYTVYNELKIVERQFGDDMPVIFLHDIGWPYNRRDLYYNPDNIPVAYRQAYAKKAIHPNYVGLVEEGINKHLNNAIYMNNPQNGVLTAVEDFLKESENKKLTLVTLPGFFGLGVIIDKEKYKNVYEYVTSKKTLQKLLDTMEFERINTIIEVNKKNEIIKDYKLKLQKRIFKIEEQEAKIEEQEAKIEEQEAKIEEQEAKIEEQEAKINNSTNKLQQLSRGLCDKQQKLEEMEKNNKKLLAELESLKYKKKELELALKKSKNESKIHTSSVRYRIGDTLINSMSIGGIIKLPYRLLKLYKYGKNKRKIESTCVKPIDNVGNKCFPDEINTKQTNVHKNSRKEEFEVIRQLVDHAHELKKYDRIQINTVDVIVCIHNALEDVKECIYSLYANRTFPYQIILVDDGSDKETKEYLEEIARICGCKLIRHDTAQGYTIAANAGLRMSSADYAILLNSDTVVTNLWIEKMIECFESNEKIGIVSPLSNAASWQTVPEIQENGDWKVNVLPEGMNVEMMNLIVDQISKKRYPSVPVLNGFCFMISRAVINEVGYLDEENFPRGYGEENDYCIRARKAGFELRILDNCYIFHEKSKSFTHEVRKVLSKKASETLSKKYSLEEIKELGSTMKETTALAEIRAEIKKAQEEIWTQYRRLADKKILFILPVKGGSGGANSVVQELKGMRKLGFTVDVATHSKKIIDFKDNYPEIEEHIKEFKDEVQLKKIARNYDIVVATIFNSVELVKEIIETYPHIVPCYYVQDYEPLFFQKEEQHDLRKQAFDSYNLIEGNHLFAKTDWICKEVNKHHQVDVYKVKPSMDSKFYNPYLIAKKEISEQIIVSAMIRPSTPRRKPMETMHLLKMIKEKYGNQVSIIIFGCEQIALQAYGDLATFEFENKGILKRWEVAALMAESDIFIDMSEYQAFGRTGLEGMALGCVPVLPIEGGVSEYARHGENAVIVDTGVLMEVFKGTCELIDNKKKLSMMREDAIRTARGYSIEGAAWSEIKFFNQLI